MAFQGDWSSFIPWYVGLIVFNVTSTVNLTLPLFRFAGLGMGGFLGLVAFVASGCNFPFGLTVMIAQFISILTAGCTGTFAPLLFTFIFERDSGKWGGPLETAVQDIVGSFAMVIISYRLLLWLGPFDVGAGDMCGAEGPE
jgi:hypothetical protein